MLTGKCCSAVFNLCGVVLTVFAHFKNQGKVFSNLASYHKYLFKQTFSVLQWAMCVQFKPVRFVPPPFSPAYVDIDLLQSWQCVSDRNLLSNITAGSQVRGLSLKSLYSNGERILGVQVSDGRWTKVCYCYCSYYYSFYY